MNEDLYLELTEKAKTHRFLYHYTSVASAEKILQNKSFLLRRLDKVNDPDENKRITGLWDSKLFVSCFSYSNDNAAYFYKEYNAPVCLSITPDYYRPIPIYIDSELSQKMYEFDLDNVRSDLNYEMTYNARDWGVFSADIADIFYTDDFSKHISDKGFEKNAGLIKKQCGKDKAERKRNWEIEKETRIRVAIRPKMLEFYLNEKQNSFLYHKPTFMELYTPIPGTLTNIDVIDTAPSEVKKMVIEIKEKYLK